MKLRKKMTLAALSAALFYSSTYAAQSPELLNDLEIAHVAYTADNIDIRYAHLALVLSNDPKIREFAQTMIRDHTAVNEQALALLQKLGAHAQDNYLSQSLQENADHLVDEMSRLLTQQV